MKKVLILTLLFFSSAIVAYAQKGTIAYLNRDVLDGITFGADVSTLPKNIVKNATKVNPLLYNYHSKDAGYLGGDIKLKTFEITVYNNKIIGVVSMFSDNGPDMLNKLIADYGPYTRKVKDSDIYVWQSSISTLRLNYSHPKQKSISAYDLYLLNRYAMDERAGALKPLSMDNVLAGRTNYFIAMQYKGPSNCIYKVFITGDMLMCAKVNGYISVEPNFGIGTTIPRSRMHNPEAYINPKIELKYDDLLTDTKAFLSADKENFIIKRVDITQAINNTEPKGGMGYYPYGGRIFLTVNGDKNSIEFILVGDQNPAEILNRLKF